MDLEAWYWTPTGELRACAVMNVWGDLLVVDLETLENVDVRPEDVLIQRPE